MAIILLSGSPSARSRSQAILNAIGRRLADSGHDVESIGLSDVPAEDLVHARHAGEAAVGLAVRFRAAEAVVVSTPVYKASLGGGLKALLDLLPPGALADKAVLPIATGGSAAHQLALDFGLKPVLSALGAQHILGGIYASDPQIELLDDGEARFADDIAVRIDRAAELLHEHLIRRRGLAQGPVDAYVLPFRRQRPAADRHADARCSA